jgi:hypothetical protein
MPNSIRRFWVAGRRWLCAGLGGVVSWAEKRMGARCFLERSQ